MHHELSLIVTIASSLVLALLFGVIAARLKLPVLIGYIVAGIAIALGMPGFSADLELAMQLSEIGVMLLMFGVGLHFSMEDLLKVRRIALPGAVVQITAATVLGMVVAHFWDWSWGQSFVFGLCLSCASTVVLLKALESQGVLESMNGRIAVGWLIVEDLAMVLVLVLLPPLAVLLGGTAPVDDGHGASNQPIWLSLGITLIKVVAFIALTLIVGRRVLPKLLWMVAKTGSRELFTLTVIASAVGVAWGASELFDVSFALGAFFAGMMMRESELSHRAAAESLPLRDAFSVLFFVSVGMLFTPDVLINSPLKVLAVVLIIVIGKTLAAIAIVLLFRYPLNTALTVGASLAQIGEFSFILASLGMSLGLMTTEANSLVLSGAIISMALNPLLFMAIGPLQKWLRQRSSFARMLEQPDDPLATLPMSVSSEHLTNHVVLVGYGRVGRRIAKNLRDRGMSYVIVEENRDLVEDLRARGKHAVAGDAVEPEVLIQAHIARAAMLIVAMPDAVRTCRMLEIARMLNPEIGSIARVHSDEEADLLHKERIGGVFYGEQELANAMIGHIDTELANYHPKAH